MTLTTLGDHVSEIDTFAEHVTSLDEEEWKRERERERGRDGN